MTTDPRRPVDRAAALSAGPGIPIAGGRDRPVDTDGWCPDGGVEPGLSPDPQRPAVSVDALGGWTPVFGPVGPVERGRDRSPESLTLMLVKAAERVRTDPGENFEACTVRWSVEILRSRLDERMPGCGVVEATRGQCGRPQPQLRVAYPPGYTIRLQDPGPDHTPVPGAPAGAVSGAGRGGDDAD